MAKARGLGRGLSSLIPERAIEEPRPGSDVFESDRVSQLPLGAIEPNPYQPRQHFQEEGLRELADSIRVHGVIQPILVRQVGRGYQIIAGERRVRAARMCGLTEVPALVRRFSDREAIELALVENLQRSDLNPIEESQAYRRLIEEFEWTQEEIGARVGKSRSHIANYLRLLQLEEPIRRLIGQQVLTVAHAKGLLSVEGAWRLILAERCAGEGWTVKQLESAIKRGEIPKSEVRHEDVHLKSIEAGLRRRFGTKVAMRGDSSKGRIEIPYRSLEELERLLLMLEGDRDSGNFVV